MIMIILLRLFLMVRLKMLVRYHVHISFLDLKI